jgi:hypothetical protein
MEKPYFDLRLAPPSHAGSARIRSAIPNMVKKLQMELTVGSPMRMKMPERARYGEERVKRAELPTASSMTSKRCAVLFDESCS